MNGDATQAAAATTPVTQLMDTEARAAQIDMKRLRAYRLNRVRQELRNRDCGAAILLDPISIRYATGYRHYQVFQMHLPSSYLLVTADGPVVLFGPDDRGLETIDEVRPSLPTNFYNGGARLSDFASSLVLQFLEVIEKHVGKRARIAVDRIGILLWQAFDAQGVDLIDAGEVMEMARYVKSRDEILCMNHAIAVAEAGLARIAGALAPGLTEIELWSILHQTNIAAGGEWIETRLLSSGDRINPWNQEASNRVIRPGDLVAIDTDMVGPLGYCADISRTFLCPTARPSDAQKTLYRLAFEEVAHNMSLLKAGVSFRDFSQRAFRPPSKYVANRYSCLVHGVGMVDEYPKVYHDIDWESHGYDGVFEENATVCVESYIGAVDGREGVKLEEQVLITSDGCTPLSRYPYEEALLGRGASA
jgi:Xaa-Pro dipeptidase